MPDLVADKYADAIRYFDKNLSLIKPPESDPVSWNLSTGLVLLAEAIQRDMAEVKKRLAAIDSILTGLR